MKYSHEDYDRAIRRAIENSRKRRSDALHERYDAAIKRALARFDAEGDARTRENEGGEEKPHYGNTRLPYGLCKKFGIDLPKGAKPHDAWAALAGKGITPEDAYKTLKETGSAEGIGQETGGQEPQAEQEKQTEQESQAGQEPQPEQEGQPQEGQENGQESQKETDPRLQAINDKFKELEEKAESGEIDTGYYSPYATELGKLLDQVHGDEMVIVERKGAALKTEYWRSAGLVFISVDGSVMGKGTFARTLRYEKGSGEQVHVSVMKRTDVEESAIKEAKKEFADYKEKEDDLINATLDGMLNFNAPGGMAWNDLLRKKSKCQKKCDDAKNLLQKNGWDDELQDKINSLTMAMMFGYIVSSTANVMVDDISSCKNFLHGDKQHMNREYFKIMDGVQKLAGGADEAIIAETKFKRNSVFGDGCPWAAKKDELRAKCRYLMAQFIGCPKDVPEDEVDSILAGNDARVRDSINKELERMNEKIGEMAKLKESGDKGSARQEARILRRQCQLYAKQLEAGHYGNDMLIDDACEAEIQAFRDVAKRIDENCPIDTTDDRYVLPDLPIDKDKGTGQFDANCYTKERKDKATWCYGEKESVKAYGKQACDAFKTATPSERHAVYEYTDGSGKFNRPLSGYHGTWEKGDFRGIGKANLDHEGAEKMISELTNFLGRNSFDNDIWVQHGFDKKSGFAAFLGIDEEDISEDNINKIIDSGSPCHWSSFMSCGAGKDTGFEDCNFILNIYCPKGTKGAYIAPGSVYGGSKDFTGTPPPPVKAGHENELLLQRDGNYRITKCEQRGNEYFLDVEVVSQEPFDYSDYVYMKPN